MRIELQIVLAAMVTVCIGSPLSGQDGGYLADGGLQAFVNWARLFDTRPQWSMRSEYIEPKNDFLEYTRTYRAAGSHFHVRREGKKKGIEYQEIAISNPRYSAVIKQNGKRWDLVEIGQKGTLEASRVARFFQISAFLLPRAIELRIGLADSKGVAKVEDVTGQESDNRKVHRYDFSENALAKGAPKEVFRIALSNSEVGVPIQIEILEPSTKRQILLDYSKDELENANDKIRIVKSMKESENLIAEERRNIDFNPKLSQLVSDECFLSFYGLPEPNFESKSNAFVLFLGLISFVAVGTGFFIFKYFGLKSRK